MKDEIKESLNEFKQ
jgi:hypothetical protein